MAASNESDGFRLPKELEEDWAIWRVVTHPQMHQSYHEVVEFWTIDDLLDANQILDAIESAQARADQKASRAAKKHGR